MAIKVHLLFFYFSAELSYPDKLQKNIRLTPVMALLNDRMILSPPHLKQVYVNKKRSLVEIAIAF
ncbi:MAG: hypothetical protein F6K53_41780 [Moorea sp. SIO4A1]|uniref:hypothetical protein n=1 Tax=Moorena sp. SIO4A1 TaxID=2607835 RepID=UPI001417F008|nr:hypothetical protein [Moorena sp. SIO4A1]NEO43038.1 hypothetical protein [Moorena sp. SIO4A3]NEQ63498.1 hypothetical protein [Moorena sp. SIO4A1]